jgi:AcrR family transcriptional regulator
MARRKLSDVTHPDLTLVDSHWLSYGLDPQPPMRLKILYVTFDEVAKSGPSSFHVASVCDRLGITYPMVNHYFGGRDGLVAEAASMIYLRHIEALWRAVQDAPRNPADRLKAWMLAGIKETSALGGWGAILNYPLSAKEVSRLLAEKFGALMSRGFELNWARLGQLVKDVRKGSVTEVSFTAENYLRSDTKADPDVEKYAPTIAWATYGVSSLLAGRHLTSADIPEVTARTPAVILRHIDLLIDMMTRDRKN